MIITTGFYPKSRLLSYTQLVQPSVADVAASKVDYLPARHTCNVQLDFEPDNDYNPAPQFVQPFSGDVDAVHVEYWLAGHS